MLMFHTVRIEESFPLHRSVRLKELKDPFTDIIIFVFVMEDDLNLGSQFSVCNLILIQLDELWRTASIYLFKWKETSIFF